MQFYDFTKCKTIEIAWNYAKMNQKTERGGGINTSLLWNYRFYFILI